MTAPVCADAAGSLGVITGASGFLGRAVLAALPPGAAVFAAYNAANGFPAWAETLAADVRPLRIDLCRQRLAPAIRVQVDWALCLAARVAPVTSGADPVGELVAVAGPAVNAVAGLRTRRLVHLSSGSVYERLRGQLGPHRVPNPQLPYSIAKLAGEHLVSSYAETMPVIVRFFGAYGPGEPHYKLTARLIDRFHAGATRITLAGDGRNRIDPMHVDDSVSALLALCVGEPEPGVLDLCQGESKTISDYAKLVYDAVHLIPPDRPLRLTFAGAAHEQMLGTADPTPADEITRSQKRRLRDGLREYAGWRAAQRRSA